MFQTSTSLTPIRAKSPSVYSSDAEYLSDEDLADADRVAVLQAQVARLPTD